MITKITGVVNRVLDEEIRLQVGAFEYQVLVPEFVRRQIQGALGQEITLYTSEYLEGNPMQGKVVPRLLGFIHESELDFFELFCTVDKVGTRKAIKALVRPINEIAAAIQREDIKWLTSLPGIGAATADGIVATLKRKVTRFAIATPEPTLNGEGARPSTVIDGNVMEDAYQALLALGLNPFEARQRLDKVLATGQRFTSADQILTAIYQRSEP
jgi:holliday junction DNA helicase RuvA